MAVPHTDFSVGGSGGGDGAFSSYSSREIEPKSSQYENEKLTVKEEEKTTTFESSSGHCGGELVRIKDEEEEEEEEEDEVEFEEDEGGAVDDGAVDGGSLPKPMEGLNDVGPPPFLRKLYEMVEDPGTDPIVSWSLNRNSFTVWDSHDFSENLLPKHFKHKNFSSFIRQLNTYGFKKVHSDRWEFANEMFQGGKRYLLKNIKRRNRFNNKPQDVTITCIDPTVELETLRNDHKALKLEILKLKQQQDHAASQMRAAAERIRCAECKQQQMLNFLAKIAKCPSYVQQLIHSRKQPRGISGAAELDYSDSKKRRYIATETTQEVPHQISLPGQYGGENVNCRKQAQEKLASMQSELTDTLPPGSNTSIVDHHRMDKPPYQALMDDDDGTSGGRQNLAAVYNSVVGNLLGDSSVVEAKTDVGYVDEDQMLSVNDTPLFHELEDLIGKPHSWAGYVNELVEQVGCVGSMY